VALADVYNTSADTAQLPHREAYSAAKKAATKALEIDEALPEGHTALAYAVLGLDWDWIGAERGLKRALELNPSSALAHGRYGDYLMFMGSSQEAIAHKERAVELDPLSLERHFSLVFACFIGGQYDRALGELREAVERNPNVDEDAGAWFSAVIHREEGMYDNAIAEFRGSLDRRPDSAVELGHLGNTYARAGRVREARECLRKLKEVVRDHRVGVYEIALIHAGLGEKDQALEWLERAYEERDGGMRYLKVDRSLDPLRSDARFQDLLRRMNFPS
jgi:tetratricopeptide (TPR) repeat protein